MWNHSCWLNGRNTGWQTVLYLKMNLKGDHDLG